jgi:UDP-Gal:alpha-D-GlcNAc-diphosphoundecaprenol beta-1,4-galactosyltransferase
MIYNSIFKKISRNDFQDDMKLKSDKPKFISFLNPSSILYMKDEQLNKLTALYVDGGLLVFVLKYLFNIKVPRASPDYTSIIGPFFEYCSKNDYSIALVGATRLENAKAAEVIKGNHVELNIKVTRSGFFENDVELDDFINDLDVDVVLVGMGAPGQELFLKRCSEINPRFKIGMTCGGFLTQTAKKDLYYNPILSKLGLRWLQRTLEYKHVRKRLVREYPYFLLEMIKYRFSHDSRN